MNEQTQKRENNILTIIRNNAWIISAICGVISLLFLLGVIVKFTTVNGEEEIVHEVHLWNYFQRHYRRDWTMNISVLLIASGIICACLRKLFNELDSASSMLFILGAIFLILTREFFANNKIANLDYVEIGWGSVGAISFCSIAALTSMSSGLSSKTISTRDIAEEGILIAAAFVLNLIKLPISTGGGSVNFQMLPLFVIALRHGPTQGLVCGGIIYGLLTCLTDGWGFATYPFDYLVAFGSVMVIGYFRPLIFGANQKGYNIKGEVFIFVACLLATVIRFFGSTTSSMVVYGYGVEAAMKYNAIYIPVSGAIATGVLMAMYGPLIQINNRYSVNK